tara:strand:+ start:223 stop:981 length:759 start_codon:yes stop_codon:yes gene_type:complete
MYKCKSGQYNRPRNYLSGMVDIVKTDTYRQLLEEELKLIGCSNLSKIVESLLRNVEYATLEEQSGLSASDLRGARRRTKKKSKRILEAKQIKENRIERVERNKRRNKRKFGTGIISSNSNIQTTNIPQDQRDAFYQTQEWKDARDEWKVGKDKVCSRCGRRPDPNYKKAPIDRNRSEEDKEFLYRKFNENRLLVDHILPIKTYWGLRLEKVNFQYLCGCCNKEKCNTVSRQDVIKVLSKVKRVDTLKVESNE